MLDIGSLGVEAAICRFASPDVDIHAVSIEGDRVFFDGRRLMRRQPAASAHAEQVVLACDAERDEVPFAAASFDLVTCFETLEHLHHTPLRLSDQIHRVLKPGGVLLLTTPNVVGTRAIARAIGGRHPQENPRYHRSERYGVVHPKEHAPYELQALCISRGFVVESLRTEYFRSVGVAERLGWWLLAAATIVVGGRFQPTGPGDNCVLVATRRDIAPVLPEVLFD